MRRTKMKVNVIMLLWIMPLTSCATSLKQLPTLKNRSLRIDTEQPRFKYQYETCSGKLFWKKCKINTEFYDFTKKETRLKLNTMGFKLKVSK